jgi:hypothetical protein
MYSLVVSHAGKCGNQTEESIKGRRGRGVTSREERRAYVRVEYTVPVVLRRLRGPEEVTGKTLNVSARGALITCGDIDEFQAGSHLDIRLVWTRETGRSVRWLRGTGRVVWMKPAQDTGRQVRPGEPALVGLRFDGPLQFES